MHINAKQPTVKHGGRETTRDVFFSRKPVGNSFLHRALTQVTLSLFICCEYSSGMDVVLAYRHTLSSCHASYKLFAVTYPHILQWTHTAVSRTEGAPSVWCLSQQLECRQTTFWKKKTLKFAVLWYCCHSVPSPLKIKPNLLPVIMKDEEKESLHSQVP